MRFEYGGDPPQQQPIHVDRNVDFCGKHGLVRENLIVHPENKGIQNVVVHVYTGRGGSILKSSEPVRATHSLANRNCRFEPHVVVAQVGDTIKLSNADPFGHNSDLSFFANPALNLLVSPGTEHEIRLEQPESAPSPIACNIHPWMNAYVIVLDHSFVGVSDENGDLSIQNLPAGDKLVFRTFHESGTFKEIWIDGERQQWRRNRFEVQINPGRNDFGTVVIPANAFAN